MYNTQNKQIVPKIGDVYCMYFNGTESEQSGWRPGVIFQNNTANTHSPNVIALPLTSSLKKLYLPTHVLVRAEDSGLKYDSVVLCENPERMSKRKIGKYITSLSNQYMEQIATASLLATSGISYLTKESLIQTWERTIQLNDVA